MKLISWNVNGLRAVWRKGFLDWFAEARPDVLCVQETRAWPDQLEAEQIAPEGYEGFWVCAEETAAISEECEQVMAGIDAEREKSNKKDEMRVYRV